MSSEPTASDTEPMTSDNTTSSTPTSRKLLTPILSVDIPTVTFSKVLETVGEDGATYLSINYLGDYIAGVYKYLLGFSTTIAIVMLMVSGLQWAFGGTSAEAIGKAKTRIKNAVTGLVLLLSTYLILFTVNPELLTLQFPKLKFIENVELSDDTASDIEGKNLPGCPTSGTNGVPYFCQRNYSDRYGASCEGEKTISSSGCGATSLAMVLSFYNVNADPRSVAASFETGGYIVCGVGTKWGAFSSANIVTDNGMESDVIWARPKEGDLIPENEQTKIISYLTDNKPIIISVGNSRFTGSGHFMVLTGINADGTVSLNDPNSGYTTATQEELWGIMKYAVYVHPKN